MRPRRTKERQRLQDVQPAGTTDTKDKKNQQYDFIFEVSGNHYTCRTSPKTSVKAIDFVVGSEVKYQVDGDKGKLKTTAGKEVKCTVVRVEKGLALGRRPILRESSYHASESSQVKEMRPE